MHCDKALLMISSFVFFLFTSPAQAATQCGTSYYCYKSMTPTKDEQKKSRIINRNVPNTAPEGRRLVRPPSTQGAANQAAQATRQLTQQQRQAQAQQRAQQQRQAQQRAQQQQRQAQQRAQQQRQAQQNRNQANTNDNTTDNNSHTTTASNSRPSLPEATLQSCKVLDQKIKELNRQAVLQSKNKAHEQAQRLFTIAGQLKKESERKKCPATT